jgi:hypothetical protein
MALAEVFCPQPLRPRFGAWGALLTELREAAFESSDPRIAAVKAPWWAEELLRFGQGQGRHPLAEDLSAPDLPWRELAGALLGQVQSGARPADPGQALAQVQPFAEAVAAVESRLFAAPVPSDPRAVAVHLLLGRLPRGLGDEDRARVPMSLLARHGITGEQLAAGQGAALLRDWAGELMRADQDGIGGQALFRRLRTGLDRVALRRLAGGRGFTPEPAPLTVFRAWRIARRG